MSLSYVRYVADGTTDEFDVPFDFVNRTHVKVTIDGVPPVLPIRWAGENRIKIADRIAAGSIVELRRETPISSRLVDFQNGSVLTEEELDTALNQIFFLQQELRDRTSDTLNGGLLGLADNEAAIDNILQRVLSDAAAQQLSNAIADIANQGNTLADLSVDLSALSSSLVSNGLLLTDVNTRLGDLRADHDSLVSTVDALLGADPGAGLATLIQNETSARIAGDNALATTLSLIGARSGDNLSFILNTNTVRVSPAETLATRLSTLSANDAGNAAAIINEQNARIAADGVLAQEIDLIDTRVGNAEASILSDRTARIAGDNALASDLALIGARVAGGSAWQLNLTTVRVGPTETLATRLSTLAAADANASAAIATEQTARVSGDNALAAALTTLTSRVGNNEATITTLQSAVNGVEARYGVSLNVNGYITGFVQNNDGVTGSFDILADRFRVVDPNGGSPVIPFEVSGGSVFIKEAFIGSLNVARLTSGALGANITQNGDWNVGTGRIVWDNGTYMKVAGVGFGTSGQFIEWFGPKTAINLCSEANAISYLKTNGDAYFGGTLSAGILRNAAQTSDIGASASVTVGPFGTNGNPIQVVTSYAIQSGFTNTYPATTTGRSNWEAAVTAWGATAQGGPTDRSVDASKSISCNVVVRLDRNGSEGWATLTITSGTETLVGTAPVAGDTPGDLTQIRTIAGSITSTDNIGGTTNRSFVATITTRTNATIGAVQFQRVGIVATEE